LPFLENGKHRDRSTYSYAAKHEALRDAEKFLEKLNETWRGNPWVRANPSAREHKACAHHDLKSIPNATTTAATHRTMAKKSPVGLSPSVIVGIRW
jgi:hypothetical protein